MCEKPETETETVTPRVAFATILQSLVAESPNKPTLPVMLSMLDQAMDHTGLRLGLPPRRRTMRTMWRKPAAVSRAGRMT